jgi:hypothetical protein
MALGPRAQAALQKHGIHSVQFGNPRTGLSGLEYSNGEGSVASLGKVNIQSGAFNIKTNEFGQQTHSDEHPGILSHQKSTFGTFLSQNEEPKF